MKYLITRRRKDNHILPRGESCDAKPKMIELDRKIGHKIIMSIRKLFMDRDEPAYLAYQEINDMEGIRDAIAEGNNGIDQLF